MTVREALSKATGYDSGSRGPPLLDVLAPKVEAALRASALEMVEVLRTGRPWMQGIEINGKLVDDCVTAGIEAMQ